MLVAVCAAGVTLTVGCERQHAWETDLLGRTHLERSPSSLSWEDGPAEEPPELGEKPALSDYLAYAALNNPGLEAAFNQWKAALERVPQVKALPDPRFTYRYFIEEVETRVGAQRQAFELAQTFPWFGKLKLRGYAAFEASEAERQRYKAKKLKLFREVKDAYYEYYYLWRAINIVGENVRLIQNIEKVLRTRYKAAAATHTEVIRAQVELGKLDDHLRTLKDLREPIVARLNAALNRSPNAPLPWPQAIEDVDVSVTDEELLAWLEHTNPEIRALDSEAARWKQEIKVAKKEYFPDVTLGVGYIDTANSTGGRRPSDDGKDPIIVMVSVNVPIWRDKLSAGVREARHRRLAAVHRKLDATNRLSAVLKFAAYGFRDANRKIDLYRDALLPKGRESLKATDASFRAGKASFTDLIDAQRILLEFELAYERALTNKAQRLAELESLTAQDFSITNRKQVKPKVREDNPESEGHRPVRQNPPKLDEGTDSVQESKKDVGHRAQRTSPQTTSDGDGDSGGKIAEDRQEAFLDAKVTASGNHQAATTVSGDGRDIIPEEDKP